ncbi:reverse transcriptase domain-containing protein [Tanacetum coccineum]
MITPKGIKSCPSKTEAVLQLPSPRTSKEVQSLNGKLASLNRFLSKSAEKSLPLFKTLKKCIKKSDFHWTSEAKPAFKQLKQHLSELPLCGSDLRGCEGISKRRVPITVITDQPIKQIMSRPDVAGRLQKWEIGGDTIRPQSCFNFSFCLFTASNNEAEYEALIAGLRIAAQMGVRNVHVSVDSKLVANQVLGTYVAKEENMVKYLEKTKSLISGFANFSISQVPRSKNKKADALSKIASTSFAHLSKQVLVEILKEKSIQEEEVATVVEEEGPTWMTPIMEYLKDGTLPGDRKEASKLRIKARQYELLDRILYKRSFLKPWLRCVGPLQADYVIREIHEGSCSMHAGPRSVVAKAMRLGYYWPTMHRDARDMIRTSGPFPEGPGKVKFLIVAMDYFTKWIEAKVVASITGNQIGPFASSPLLHMISLNITQRFATVKHPPDQWTSGQEQIGALGEGVKARLAEGKSRIG